MLCRRWVVTLFLACCSAFAIFFYVFHGIFDIRSRVCELYTQRSHQNCSGGRPPTDFRQTIPVPGSGHSRLTEEFEGLFWFVQITDIHISVHDGLSRAEDLKKFCRSRIPVIKPDLVIASGDLSDSKTADKYDSFQYRTEWELYRAAIRDSGVLNITHWLDIRGNHDAFDVPGLDHEENYFKTYGVQGRLHPQSYSYTLQKPYGRYSFIGFDACLNPGLKRPLNFFGEVTPESQVKIKQLAEEALGSNQVFWFGHYPTSSVVSPQLDLRNLIGRSAFAYLCGHFHTCYGLVPRMYAFQPEGYIELELGDWRDSRYYRIVAVDHDLVSFVDMEMPTVVNKTEWPVVLVTNPKDANFLLPNKEPTCRISDSTHIRILAWSEWPITLISVHIDGIYLGDAVQVDTGKTATNKTAPSPLYTLAWDPKQWTESNVHTIEVSVQDARGNQRIVSQPFALNGTPLCNYPFFQSYFIHTDHTFNLRAAFSLTWILIASAVVLPRILPQSTSRPLLFGFRFTRGLYYFSNNGYLLYPFLIYLIYVLACPVFMGFLTRMHFGVVFSFGIYVAGNLILDSLTFFHEMVQLFLFFWTSLLSIFWYLGGLKGATTHDRQKNPSIKSNYADCKGDQQAAEEEITLAVSRGTRSVCSIPLLPFVITLTFTFIQIYFTLSTVYFPYGMLAFILSPGRILPLVLSWYFARTVGQV